METTRIIEQYLEGTLGEDDRRKVEDRAREDKDFRALIRLHREVDESIRDNELALLHDLIKRIGDDFFRNQYTALPVQHIRQNTGKRRIILRMAAVIVFIVAAGVALKLLVISRMSPEKLYLKHYAAYDADAVLRSSGTAGTNLGKAILSYSLGNHAEALTMLDGIIRNDPGNNPALFYRGLALMETGDAKRAILSFRAIPVDWGSPFNEHRNWYLALALLKERRTSEAAELLCRIISGKGFYAERAEKIVKKLRL
jgi:tetratricopeptide (TPR) repeat protein